MGRDLLTVPAAKRCFDLASELLGFDLADVCLQGPQEKLNQTDISQPALFTCGVASYHAAVEQGKLSPADLTDVAGLSLGEYTALHLAGVLSFEDGVRLVSARGRFMQEAAVATPSGMVAIIGADDAQLTELLAAARGDDVLVPANYNAPGQVVLSGGKAACERAVNLAGDRGIKAVPLAVAGAFHSPIMQVAADRLGQVLDAVAFRPPACRVWSNVTGQPHGDDVAEIKRRLVEQIIAPVRWEQTMLALTAQLPDARYVELAPGRTLAGLAKRVNRRLAIESLGG